MLEQTVERYQKYYEICERFQWDISDLIRYCHIINMDYNAVFAAAKKYALEELHIPKKALESKITNDRLRRKKQKAKEYYDLCESVNWDQDAILRFVETNNITLREFVQYVSFYGVRILRKYEQEVMNHFPYYQKNVETSNYKLFFDLLVNEDDYDKIEKAAQKYKIQYGGLSGAAFDYVIVYYKEKKDEMLPYLRSKIEWMIRERDHRFQQERKKREEEQEKLLYPNALVAVVDFLNSSYTSKQEFCKENDLKDSIFDNYLSIIKKYKPNLYEKVKEKIFASQKERFRKLAVYVNYIIKKIKNGITEGEMVRPFDIIDFYFISPLTLDQFLIIAKKVLQKADLTTAYYFYNQNQCKTFTAKDISQLMYEKLELDGKRDQSGCLIPGTGKLVTKEEKAAALQYLDDVKIQKNRRTYLAALKRLRANHLVEKDGTPYQKSLSIS